MDRTKRIVVKKEPQSSSDTEEGDGGAPRGAPKQAASPAQEATRAHILGLEQQMRRLKGTGRLDAKGAFQVRCLEEELRKAHSKLKRLLNEAERQRRRRERLRSGCGPRTPSACHQRTLSTCPQRPLQPPVPRDDGIMAALKSCTRFQDFVRELNVLGFALTQQEEPSDNEETMPEVDGVKVQVELIEGDEELSTDFKGDISSQDPIASSGASRSEEDTDSWTKEESYRRWFERQTRLQQRWEEGFMREQMELARGLLESVTTTFLQGVQQVLTSVTGGRRFPPHHFCPPSEHPS